MDNIQQRICTACGTQFPLSDDLPRLCPICDDDRQYIPEAGQSWTSTDEISGSHTTAIKEITDNLYEIKITPSFAIGQRALLVVAPDGNILWDCIPLLEQPTIDFIRSKGGLKAIAFSHPHYYSNMGEWAAVFDCAIYIHRNDQQWIMQDDSHISLWSETEKLLWNDIRIIKTGGHFAGSCILYIAQHPAGGMILCGDSLQISRSRRHIAIMYSYPNFIPLALHEIQRIKQQVQEIPFDSMYGAFDFQNLAKDAREIFIDSMNKYV